MGKTTTNSTTKAILQWLNYNGFRAYSVYNGAVYSAKRESYLRNPNKLKGIPDICGYRFSDGKALFVEIKTGKDRVSPEQLIFHTDAKKAECIVLVCKSTDDFMEQIKPYIK